MDVALRLILRFILVPLGYFAAVLAGAAVILFGAWRLGEMAASLDPDQTGFAAFGFVRIGPVLNGGFGQQFFRLHDVVCHVHHFVQAFDTGRRPDHERREFVKPVPRDLYEASIT